MAYVVSKGGSIMPSSFLCVALPSLITKSVKERHLVFTILLASGMCFIYSSVMLIRQARRTYMVARASILSRHSNKKGSGRIFCTRSRRTSLTRYLFEQHYHKSVLSVVLLAIYLGSLALHVHLSMNDIKSIWLFSLKGSNGCLFESMVLGTAQYIFLHCALNLHGVMIDPLMMAYANAKQRNADRRAFLRYFDGGEGPVELHHDGVGNSIGREFAYRGGERHVADDE